MHRLKRLVIVTGMLLLACTAAANAEEPQEEQLLYRETGETRHGTIEPQFAPATKAGEISEETRRQLEAHWERLLAKRNRKIPPLKINIGVDPATFVPDHPPSELANHSKGDSFELFKNTEPTAVVPGGASPWVNEPTVVASGDNVFYAGNWYSATSSNGGDSFTFSDPFAGPFPDPLSGDFCCDQVTAHDPATDTLFYMQQFFSDADTGIHRINVDSDVDGSFDCFYDISPQTHGFAAQNFPDFPDLAVSNGFLYHSANVFSTTGGGFTGAFTARYVLSALASCSSVPFDTHTDSSGFFSFKLTRGARDTMYFADHISTSMMRIWRWPDADMSPTIFDRTVASWSDSTRVCPGPDGRDWCGFIDRRIMAAYVADGVVGFMWVPSQGGSFTFPYTRIAQFSEASLTLVGEPIIWSTGFAWAYPSVAVNGNGDLGGTVTAGGGATLDPSCVAWIADDVNGDNLAPLENQVALFGSSGPATNRLGDFNSTSTYHPNNYLWAGACFALTDPNTAEARYVLFGREKDGERIFADGFESGNTSRW